MQKIIPITDLQTHPRRVIDDVRRTGDAATITQRGRPAAMIVNCEVYEGLVATLEEMSEPDWRERLVEAERASRAGEGVMLEEYQRKRGKTLGQGTAASPRRRRSR